MADEPPSPLNPYRFAQWSWRLKLDRAQHHMKELEAEIGRYADRHAYEARRVHEGYPKDDRWRYALHVTEQPHFDIAIVLGDVLTNLRAALDHLAVALAPRGRKNHGARFPIIEDVGMFNPTPTEKELAKYTEARERFGSAVSGMEPEAIAVLDTLQPYRINPFPVGAPPQIHPFVALNRLVNADKHKKLVPVATGLVNVTTFVVVDSIIQGNGWYAERRDEGAIVAEFSPLIGTKPPPESKVKVHVSGTPRITANVVEGYGNSELLKILSTLIDGMATSVFPALEPYIKPWLTGP